MFVAVVTSVATLVFGAWEPKTGAVGSLWDVVRDRRLNHRPEVVAADLRSGAWSKDHHGLRQLRLELGCELIVRATRAQSWHCGGRFMPEGLGTS